MCFTPDTLIDTPQGPVPARQLSVGKKVLTRDHGVQVLTGVIKSKLRGQDVLNAPHLQPVHIQSGVLGAGLPENDMLVSPNQRVLVSNDRTSLMFKGKDALVAAKHLVDHDKIQQIDAIGIEYVHLQFQQHETVCANAVWSECFQPHDNAMGALGNGQRNEVCELFPELRSVRREMGPPAAKAKASASRSLKRRFAFR